MNEINLLKKIDDLENKFKLLEEQHKIEREEFQKQLSEEKFKAQYLFETEKAAEIQVLNLKTKLNVLRSNFPEIALKICSHLKNLYLKDRFNKLVRNSFQLSIIGIFWTKILELPGFHGTRGLDFLKSGQSMDLDRAENVWEKISMTAKVEISNWILNFSYPQL